MNKMSRPIEGRKIAGVCLALGNRFELDTSIVRLIFLAATIFGSGFGILFYLMCWAAIPSDVKNDVV